MHLPKYSRLEHERRFLVRRETLSQFVGRPYWLIRDKYLKVGRLRLRAITEFPSGKQTFKLCKKFESGSQYSAPMTNIYLSREEFDELNIVSGWELTKHRYHDEFKNRSFGVDFFLNELAALAMCEVECESESSLMAVEFPEYAVTEVTTHPFFTGGNLCKTATSILNEALDRVLELK